MFGRSEVQTGGGGGTPVPRAEQRRVHPPGTLDALLAPRPPFRTALRGYDRVQVDDHVARFAAELLAVRRANDELLARYGACSAELEISRRLLACSPAGREQVRTSERVGEILRLAADEAARLTEAGADDGDRIRAVARAEADALLRRARQVKEDALADCERMRAEAEQARAAAAEEVARARAEVRRTAARLDEALVALVGLLPEEQPPEPAERAPLPG